MVFLNTVFLTGAAAVSSDMEKGPISPEATAVSTSQTTTEGSDEDELHPCRWAGCDTSATSLDQLIVHIKEVHIGSGKVKYNHLYKIELS